MNQISQLQKLGFRLKNLPGMRRFIETNRWLVRLYFEYRYHRPDPYQTSISSEEIEKLSHTFQLIGETNYKNILDIGCGEGYLTEKLANIGSKVTALDISRHALKRARNRLKSKTNVTFICSDILSWQAGRQTEERFDLIICSEVLYYLNLNQIKMIIPKIISWLTPYGKLILTHIVTKEESQDGLPLKKLGAKTIHPLFINSPYFNTIYYEDCGTYIITLLEKIASAS